MKGWVNLCGINRIYIVGAGFSTPAGFPLTNQLLKEIHNVAAQQRFPDKESEFGQADWLLEKLQFYYPLAKISHDKILNDNLPEDFDLEKFISFVNVESACQLNTSEQFNEHGSQFAAYLKMWIAKAISCRQENTLLDAPNFYNEFISLTQDSIIFTFNWDTFLESLVELNGRSYELDSRANFQPGVLPIFKLHGSIDWFYYPSSVMLKDWMKFVKLGDTFEGLYRAKASGLSLNKYYEALLSPCIIVPAYDKIDQIKQLGGQWSLLYMFFQNELEVIIIGYSMREDDYHTRAIIYPQLVQGSRDGSIKVKVIDLAKSATKAAAIKNRFLGVENCQFYLNGFCSDALAFIKS